MITNAFSRYEFSGKFIIYEKAAFKTPFNSTMDAVDSNNLRLIVISK